MTIFSCVVSIVKGGMVMAAMLRDLGGTAIAYDGIAPEAKVMLGLGLGLGCDDASSTEKIVNADN